MIARLSPILILIVTLFGCLHEGPDPLAEKGVLNLEGWDFAERGIAKLDGHWTLYRQRLLTPAELSGSHAHESGDTVHIPGHWLLQDAWTHATCVLKVLVPPASPPLALRVGDINSAYRLWVNGKPAAAVGEVGTTRQDETPRCEARIIPVDPSHGEIHLVLQVSNYHDNAVGVADTILLGRESDIRSQARTALGLALLLSGCLLMIGVYHILLYLIRLKDRSLLYFGLLCIEIGISYLVSNRTERFLFSLLPVLDMEGLYRIDLLAFYLSVPTTLMFVHALFPREAVRLILRLFHSAAAVFVLVVLTFPDYIFVQTLYPYYLLAFVGLIYAALVLARAVSRKREGSVGFLAGFAVFIITAGNDILYANRLLQTGYILPVGILALVVSHSFLLALKFFRAYASLQENRLLKMEIMEKRLNEEKALILAEKATLEMLRYQLNPHFLFNSLASIRGAVIRDPHIARDMITNLAEFCRLILSHKGKDPSPVREEVELSRLYLNIEKVRLGDYLSVSIHMEPAFADLPAPSFLLQPLVENAVKYGRQTSPERLEVRIIVDSGGRGRLLLEVANTGAWIEPKTGSRKNSFGIGLDNLRQRLEMLFSGEASIETITEDGWVRVRVEMPLAEAAES